MPSSVSVMTPVVLLFPVLVRLRAAKMLEFLFKLVQGLFVGLST